MAALRQETVINNATFSATVTSGNIQNDGRTMWVLDVLTGALTTTPTLTPALNVSWDNGATWHQVGPNITAISAQGFNRYVYALGSTQGPVLEPLIQVVCTFGGSGSFANTSVFLFGAGFFE